MIPPKIHVQSSEGRRCMRRGGASLPVRVPPEKQASSRNALKKYQEVYPGGSDCGGGAVKGTPEKQHPPEMPPNNSSKCTLVVRAVGHEFVPNSA